MKETLNYLFENNTLSKKEAKSILLEIGQGKHNNSQIASFMTIFCMRAIHTEEISGFREAMLELSLQVNLKEYQAMDIVPCPISRKIDFASFLERVLFSKR